MSSSPIPSLQQFLESILLPQYLDVLTDSGYDTLHKCAVLTSDDLDRIGISRPGHKKRILSQLTRFNLKPECESDASAETSSDDRLPVTVDDAKSADIPEEQMPVDTNIIDSPLVNLSNILII